MSVVIYILHVGIGNYNIQDGHTHHQMQLFVAIVYIYYIRAGICIIVINVSIADAAARAGALIEVYHYDNRRVWGREKEQPQEARGLIAIMGFVRDRRIGKDSSREERSISFFLSSSREDTHPYGV